MCGKDYGNIDLHFERCDKSNDTVVIQAEEMEGARLFWFLQERFLAANATNAEASSTMFWSRPGSLFKLSSYLY